jgi:hypothetical protein
LRVSLESDLAIFTKCKEGKFHFASVFVVIKRIVVVVDEVDGVGTGSEIVHLNPGLTIIFIEIQIVISVSAVFKVVSVAFEDLEPKVFHLVSGRAVLIHELSIIWSLYAKHYVLSPVDLDLPRHPGKSVS